MSPKRASAPPPQLPGFTFVRSLGSGGFADVYLYEQERPRRLVAVKVLAADLKTADARRRFESEANLMAQLSSHPYIVTIFEAEITPDGHSYLAMEYCSRPSLDVRYRRERFGVDEVLAIGVQVAGAVETAHRAGIAHRDIKPANILVTDYNRPALTDFGISGTTDAEPDTDTGMSIPWSPPEAFTGTGRDGVRMDVWALGATLYTLLAGRSPFVLPGGDNSQRALISRITTTALPQLGRPDVPASLEAALAATMAKDPASRYPSARAFALALQRIQAELNYPVTSFEVIDDSRPEDAGEDEDAEATRVRDVLTIDPDAPTRPLRDVRAGAHPAEGTTTVPDAEPTRDRPQGRRRRIWPAVAAGAAVLAAAGAAVVVLSPQAAPPARPAATISRAPADALDAGGFIPEVSGLTAKPGAAGTVVFSWKNPAPKPGDKYMVRTVTADGKDGPYKTLEKTTVTVPQASDGRTCIEVQLRRADGQASADPPRKCLG